MSDFKGLRTLIYLVPTLAEGIAWYSQAFETKPYFENDYYVGFNIGGYELGLEPSNIKPEDKTDSIFGYWGVDDVPKTIEKLVALGATEYHKPQDVGEGIIVASVKDPFGNVLGLIYNPHFKLL